MASRFLFSCRKAKSPQSRASSGATAVEMALLAPVFCMFLIGLTELGLMLTAQQIMENAAYNASRLGSTGFVSNGQTQGQTVSQVVINELQGYGTLIDTSKIQMTETAYNDFALIGTGGSSGFGTAQQIVVYTISYPWRLFTPMMGQMIGRWDQDSQSWIFNLSTQIVVRNEPYS